MIEDADRGLLDATLAGLTGQFDGADLTNALDEFGWSDVLAADPAAAVSSLFTAQGRSVVWSSAFHDALAINLGSLDRRLDDAGAVLLPRPGARCGADTVDGLLVGTGRPFDWVLASLPAAHGPTIVLRASIDAATDQPLAGLDPSLGLRRISFRVDQAEVLAEGEEAETWWTEREMVGRLALSHQLCGLIETMLDLARAHAGNRVQFGQLIGTFQAVRTRLAETYVALAGARASAEVAWECSDGPLAACVAKLIASRASATAAAHCQQVLAGVGYTAEHPFHLAFKQASVLERLLGSAADLAPEVGRTLIERGAAPRLFDLVDQ
jgi:hypothetical protein